MSDDYPPLRELRIHVCAACIAREGSECHTPGCWFWLTDVADLPEHLAEYVEPPLDLPETLRTFADVKTVCERRGLERITGEDAHPNAWITPDGTVGAAVSGLGSTMTGVHVQRVDETASDNVRLLVKVEPYVAGSGRQLWVALDAAIHAQVAIQAATA